MDSTSQGIRAMLGVNLPYPLPTTSRRSKTTILLCRPGAIQNHSINYRHPGHSGSMKFYPSDFVPFSDLPESTNHSTLFELTLDSIASIVSTAEGRAIAATAARPSLTPKSFRERSASPPVTMEPTSGEQLPYRVPSTPVKQQKPESFRLQAVMTKAGLWTPPNSQEKSSPEVRGGHFIGSLQDTPVRRSPRTHRVCD